MRLQLSEIILLGTASAVLIVPAYAQSIYKWEDDNGVPHYSDVPRDGAVEIDLQPVQTFKSPGVVPRAAPSVPAKSDDKTAVFYQSFAVSRPGMEETFWNTGGTLNVVVSLQPGLRMGHRIRVYLDGTSRGNMPAGTSSLSLAEISRGEHQLYAEVRDENDRMLIRAPTVTFFVQQTAAADKFRGTPVPPVSRRKTVR